MYALSPESYFLPKWQGLQITNSCCGRKPLKDTISFQENKSQYLKKKDLGEKPPVEESKQAFHLCLGNG